MEIIEKKICEIKPYDNNPRNNDNAVEAVANSISEFGFKVPIVVDKNNEIVAGHTRYKAAKILGLQTVPCVVAEDLDDNQVKAFRIADNKVAENATWNLELLSVELDQIQEIDMEQFGEFDLEHNQVEDLADIDNTGDTLESYDHYLSIDKTKIVITEAEHCDIMDKYNDYVKQNGVSFGFVEWLINGD